jgi:hypothetical protein
MLSAGSLPEVFPPRIQGRKGVNPSPNSGQDKGGQLRFPLQNFQYDTCLCSRVGVVGQEELPVLERVLG